MRPKTEATTNQTAAQANKTITGTRQEASMSAGGATGPERGSGETVCDDEEVAIIKKRRSGLPQLFPCRDVANPRAPVPLRVRRAGLRGWGFQGTPWRQSSTPGREGRRTCSQRWLRYMRAGSASLVDVRLRRRHRRRLFDPKNQIRAGCRRVLPLLQRQFHGALHRQTDDALVLVLPIVFVEGLGVGSALFLQVFVALFNSMGADRFRPRVMAHRCDQQRDDEKRAQAADSQRGRPGFVDRRLILRGRVAHRSPHSVRYSTFDLRHFTWPLREKQPLCPRKPA